MAEASVVIVGGSGGIGREIARHYADQGKPVVITGRDPGKARDIASEIGEGVRGIAFDLADPPSIAAALSDVGPVSRLVLTAIARDNNPVKEYDYSTATYLTTMKLVGYTETIHTLLPNLTEAAAVVLYGGLAKERPYPGGTTVATVNGGITSLIRPLAIELAPIRFNAIHPGIVGDSPYWKDKPLDVYIDRTPTGRLATMADVVDATVFLLENESINGVNLYVDSGWMVM